MTLEQELDALLAQALVELDAFQAQVVEKRRQLAEIRRLMRLRETEDRERQSHLTPVRPPSMSDMQIARETAEAFGNANDASERATKALSTSATLRGPIPGMKPVIPKPKPEK